MEQLQEYLRYLRIEPGDLVTPICQTKSFVPGKSYPVEKIAEGGGNVIYLEGQPANRDKFQKIQWKEKPWKPIQTYLITLTESEQYIAKMIANLRNAENVKQDRPDLDGATEGSALHEIGVPGEMAIAKQLNLYFAPEFKSPQKIDLNPDIQVRTGLKPPHSEPHLILHHRDDDNHRFVKVIKRDESTYEAMGWLIAKEGKLSEHWKDPSRKNRPAFFVPMDKLWPMEFLK
jgi:hypothetical protein